MGKQKTDANGDTLPPQRSDEHEIDDDAVRIVRTQLTSNWVERAVSGRDYGIDMMLEAFAGRNPTGTLVMFQIKGRKASFGTGGVSLSVPVKTLLYARMFQAPFFLVHVSVADKRTYFVWLQKYINSRLTFEHPRWTKQEKVTIHFPPDNELNGTGLAKIRTLATSVAHRDLGIAFLGHLVWLQHHFDEFRACKHRSALVEVIARTKQIEKLQPFLDPYIDASPDLDVDFEDLLAALKKAESYGDFDYDDDERIEEQVGNLQCIARLFLSEDESTASAAEDMDTGLPF